MPRNKLFSTRAKLFAGVQACVNQLMSGIHQAYLWSSDGSHHDSKMCFGRVVCCEVGKRGLLIHIMTESGRRRLVNWRVSLKNAGLIVDAIAVG